jgi:hypothetical protein
LAGVLVLLMVGGCATGHMWNSLTRTDHNRKAMYYEPGTPASWVDYVGAVLLAPITLAIDIVLFPVQLLGGYWPYGEKDPP